MDDIDTKILFNLLRDGRMTQRLIAKNLGISAQTLNYRITKLTEDGVVKNYTVHATPALYGKITSIVAFSSDVDVETDYFIKVSCLERITLFGLYGDTIDEVDQKIAKISKTMGEPVMKYTPLAERYRANSNSIDMLIVDQLRKSPKAKIADIAKELNLPSMRVKRRYSFLIKNRLISVIPIIDLSKTTSVIFAIFSHNTPKIEPILENNLIIQIGEKNTGIFICFADSLNSSKDIIKRVREIEGDSDVMVVYDYDFVS